MHTTHPKLLSAIVMLVFLLCAQLPSALANQKLVSEGVPNGCIVVPAGAGEGPVLTAAKDLSGYLKSMSGADVPIKSDGDAVEGFRILIGQTGLAETPAADLDVEHTGSDGFIIRSIPDGVLIVGRTPAATANGVYHFAEEVLGVHWYSVEDDEPTCPSQSTIEIPATLDWTIKPDSSFRGQYFSFQQAPEYADSSLAQKLDANRNRWWTFNRLWCLPAETGHAFSAMVPPSLYKEHPDYFVYLDYTFKPGTRERIVRPNSDGSLPHWPFKVGRHEGGESAQRCLSNPAVQKLSSTYVAKLFDADPNLQFASLSANDGPWWCVCDQCLAMGPTDSHRNLAFCNAVAQANEQSYSDRGYVFYVYWDTIEPPTGMTAHPSLVPMIAPLWHCLIHPISANCPDSVHHRKVVDGWSAIATRISARPYVTPGPFTFPGILTMSEEMQYYQQHQGLGFFREYQFQPAVNWALMAWAEARLLWDVDQDPVQLRREFIEGYYGPDAADSIEAVYDSIERNTGLQKRDWPKDDGNGLHSLKGTDLLKPVILQCKPQIEAALRTAESQPDVFKLRIQRDMNALLTGQDKL